MPGARDRIEARAAATAPCRRRLLAGERSSASNETALHAVIVPTARPSQLDTRRGAALIQMLRLSQSSRGAGGAIEGLTVGHGGPPGQAWRRRGLYAVPCSRSCC
jgi:hypothetical protein